MCDLLFSITENSANKTKHYDEIHSVLRTSNKTISSMKTEYDPDVNQVRQLGFLPSIPSEQYNSTNSLQPDSIALDDNISNIVREQLAVAFQNLSVC